MRNKIYSRKDCGFCVKAKDMLWAHSIEYEEIEVLTQEDFKNMQKECNNSTSVPQIILDGIYIGGYNALVEHLEIDDV